MATLTQYVSSTNNAIPAGFTGQFTTPTTVVGSAEGTTVTTTGATQNGDYGNHCFMDFSSIPTGSTINSVTLEARHWASAASRGTFGYRIDSAPDTQIATEVTATTVGTTSPAAGQPGTNGTFTTFSALPTVAQLQSANFGVRARFRRTASQADSAVFDWVRITVDYTPAGAALDQSASDTLSVADSVASGRALAREPAVASPDTLALVDSVASQVQVVLTKSVVDTLALGLPDSVTRTLAQARAAGGASDTLNVADSQARTLSGARALTDSLSVQDAIQKTRALVREPAVADSLALADSRSMALAISRAMLETLPLADGLATSRSIAQALVDVLTFVDSVDAAGAGQLNKSVIDALSATDLASSSRALSRSASDFSVLSDSVAFSRTIAQALVDALSVADSEAASKVLERTIYDVLALADDIQGASSMDRSTADLLSTADSIGYTIALPTPLVTPDTRISVVGGESWIFAITTQGRSTQIHREERRALVTR